MEATAATVGAWLLSSLLGGGVVATVGYLALKEKLTRDLATDFAKNADLNNLGSRVNGLETVAVMARDAADGNTDRLTRLEQAVATEQNALSRTLTRMDKTLEDIDTRQRDDRSKIDRTVALLDALEKRIDRHDNRRRT